MGILIIYLVIGIIVSALYQFFIYKKEGSEKYFEDPKGNLMSTLVVFLFWPFLFLIDKKKS
jgi:hypothetical protein